MADADRKFCETWTVYLEQASEEGPSPAVLIEAGIKALGLGDQVRVVEDDYTDGGWGAW